jgi:subtilisin family serine protease
MRIEADRGNAITLDSTALHVNALSAYQGVSFPQTYTGKGVVMGVMDIGFDLTHPTFYDTSMTVYRIGALWDQLSADTVGSNFYVGRDYVGKESLLALQHCRDGFDQTHGTHTSGIAAGSGYNSLYRGLAWESELCLVANAVSADTLFVSSADMYKYTYATDALGFKYIFDYADAQGKPCVINFSEGSDQDFHGYDQLYYAILDSLTGPGHIIVSSAGNNADYLNYIHKSASDSEVNFTVTPNKKHVFFTMKSSSPFLLSPLVSSAEVLASPDSLFSETLPNCRVSVLAYPSSYNDREICYDVSLTSLEGEMTLSLKDIENSCADIEVYRGSGTWSNCAQADNSHCINSPASAPNVICVGANSYRKDFYTFLGEHCVYNRGENGTIGSYSSVGPTFDGRLKPEVVAPGTNIISGYSSFYEEAHPDARDVLHSDTQHFQWNGRTYAWNCNSGTSMASPVVAGGIALWLQANPKLTPEDIKKIFANTCIHPDATLSYPNNSYGYGQIDVAKGLQYILESSGIESSEFTKKQSDGVRKVIRNGHIYIVNGDATYTLQGVKVQDNK